MATHATAALRGATAAGRRDVQPQLRTVVLRDVLARKLRPQRRGNDVHQRPHMAPATVGRVSRHPTPHPALRLSRPLPAVACQQPEDAHLQPPLHDWCREKCKDYKIIKFKKLKCKNEKACYTNFQILLFLHCCRADGWLYRRGRVPRHPARQLRGPLEDHRRALLLPRLQEA